MSRPQKWTDEQIEREIERLNKSEHVRLARKEHQIKNRRRQYMWTLQHYEARGKQLESMGCNFENMEEVLYGNNDDEETLLNS